MGCLPGFRGSLIQPSRPRGGYPVQEGDKGKLHLQNSSCYYFYFSFVENCGLSTTATGRFWCVFFSSLARNFVVVVEDLMTDSPLAFMLLFSKWR